MKRRSRIRWVATWLTTLLFVSLAVLWVVSGWKWLFVSDGHAVTCYIDRGVITLTVGSFRDAARFLHGDNDRTGLPAFSRGDGWRKTPTDCRGPLIDVIAASFVAAALLWLWPARRPPPGSCPECGYNLTGNLSGRCPECGTPCSGARSPAKPANA